MYHAAVHGLLVVAAAVLLVTWPHTAPNRLEDSPHLLATAAGPGTIPGGADSPDSHGEIEKVLAVVNNVPILLSDVELAEVARLVPRDPHETDQGFREAVVDALVALELRWRNLEAAGIPGRIRADLDGAWQRVVERAGGEEQLRSRLHAHALQESDLRLLVRRAAVVEAYVASRFAPFVRPTPEEIESVWRHEVQPRLAAEGRDVDSLEPYRQQLEQLVRERKLDVEIRRWTEELQERGEVTRYRR